jgi:hypothetical protein
MGDDHGGRRQVETQRVNVNTQQDRLIFQPYIDKQQHLNVKMRAILLDWIEDVHNSRGFLPDTYFYTAYILDTVRCLYRGALVCPAGTKTYSASISKQYLNRVDGITREKLQLVGVTAFLLAAKEFETHPPHQDDCGYWTEHGESLGEPGYISRSSVSLISAPLAHLPAYSGDEVGEMEAQMAIVCKDILTTKSSPDATATYKLPTVFTFLESYLNVRILC